MFAPLDTAALLEELTRDDPDSLAERARGLQARRDALDAEEAALLIEVDHIRAQGRSWFRDTAGWLQQQTGVAAWTARNRSRVAAQLAVLPAARAALAAGRIGFDHARILAEHADSPNRDNLLDRSDEITGWAEASSADAFRDRLAAWARDLDEQREDGLTDHAKARRRRKVVRGRTRDGRKRLTLELDDIDMATTESALRDIFAEMQRAQRELDPDLRTSTPNLWADAFMELVRRSRGADVVTKHKARPVILALTEMSVLWDRLREGGYCELADGTKLTARQLRRLACEADIIPMTLDARGVPLDMGRAVRLATYEQRFALRALHPTCAVEGCAVDFDWCEIHHLRPWEKGGPTDLDNLIPLCSHHHHWIHDADGEPNLDGVGLELLPDRTLRLRRLPQPPARQRRRRPDLGMGGGGGRPPDLGPAR